MHVHIWEKFRLDIGPGNAETQLLQRPGGLKTNSPGMQITEASKIMTSRSSDQEKVQNYHKD